MRKHTIFLLGMIGCMLLSCERVEEQSIEMDTQIQETEEQTTETLFDSVLTHTKLALDIPGLRMWDDSDGGYLLSNGDVLLKQYVSSFRGHTFYRHFLCQSDGTMREFGDNKYLRVVLETDKNEIIITGRTGKTTVYDQNWNVLYTPETRILSADPLDGGRYFAVNDSYMVSLEGAEGGDGAGSYNHYLVALYRYTEKLTECVYTHIEPCEEGFLCKNIDTRESVIIEVDDKVEVAETAPSSFARAWDEESQKFYYMDAAGEKLGEQLYDFAWKPIQNQAIAKIDGRLYLVTDASNSAP